MDAQPQEDETDPHMPGWEATLQGDPVDLEHLVRHFSSGQLRIFVDAKTGETLLCLPDLPETADSRQVLSEAVQIAKSLSGALRVAVGAHIPVTVSGVQWRHEDGRRVISAKLTGITARSRIGELTPVVTDAHGNIVPAPVTTSKIVRVMQLAQTDAAVAKLLRLIAEQDAATWVGAYRIYELIEHHAGGSGAIAVNGWASRAEQELFTRTANSAAASGDASRHGADRFQAPVKPMSLDTAIVLVKRICDGWLDEQLAASLL